MPSLPMTGAGPSSGWTPLSIAGLQLWLDASTITGVADNTDLSTWSDLSGNARHSTQSTAADKPHFQVAYQNGLGAVEFDGANHWLVLDFSSAVAAADHTIIIAAETRDTATNTDQRFLSFKVGELNINSVTSTAGKVGYWETNWVHAADATDAAQVLSYQMDNAGAEIFRDGVSIADSLTLVNRALGSDSAVGAFYDGRYQFDGHLFEVLIYSPMINATNRAAVEAHLISKWGI